MVFSPISAHSPGLDFEAGSSLDHLQAASIQYRFAIGPQAGRKAPTLYTVPLLEDEPASGLVASIGGFSLHAGTVCESWERSRLERLCRYITRPPIATKRLSIDAQGRVVYRYKRPFRDGSTHVVLEPLDFMARLAALVPRPRLNLTRFHGVFAPNFQHHQRIVPHHPRGRVDSDKPLAPMSWAQRLKRVLGIDIETFTRAGNSSIPDWPVCRKVGCGRSASEVGVRVRYQSQPVRVDLGSDLRFPPVHHGTVIGGNGGKPRHQAARVPPCGKAVNVWPAKCRADFCEPTPAVTGTFKRWANSRMK